ncbi:hypothetical protein [Phaeodactylibacter luteus]|uniref:Uncharacterized protein n=1 Tax=Phaeodactylibacter luteus TaxID=1564516 RepID=A0A5C6RK61_9BACT|nr:hypothetical protein [Phaeodactylibacter luteus]TXB62295.1 hypothetical protein FRY97_14700 [Phaeodactylibacter luteus]
MKNIGYIILIMMTVFAFSACEKEETDSLEYGLAPEKQLDMLCRALRLDGQNIEGEMPSGTGQGNALIVSHPEAVEISAGVLLFIPYTVRDTNDVCKVFLQVDGANNYWETRLIQDPSSGQPFFEILIPKFVQEGDFDLVFSIEDCNGNVSPVYSTLTSVQPAGDCDSAISGSVGITVRTFDLGEKKGEARFLYEMYSIRDRLDIRYNGDWVASTGSLFSDAVRIPNCDVMDGFVSGAGILTLNYDPSVSRTVEVYISGCFSGTLWDLRVDCPE